MTKTPAISAVIPCHDAAGTVIETLLALDRTTPRLVEIVCVDDGSGDDTAGAVRQAAKLMATPVRLVQLAANAGAATARNRGAAAATSELLLFVDADVVVRSDTLAELCRRLDATSATAVVALYEPRSFGGGHLADFQSLLAHVTFSRLDADELPYFGTQGVLVRRSAFDELSGFRESYRGATVEDLEFGARLQESGGRVVLAPAARIAHNRPFSVASFTTNYVSKARGLAALAKERGASSAALGSGYSAWSNVLALGLVTLALTLTVAAVGLGLAGGRAATAVVIVGVAILCAVGTGVLWRPFLTIATRVHGLPTAVWFALLRCYVTYISAAGVALAAVAKSPAGTGVIPESRPATGEAERS